VHRPELGFGRGADRRVRAILELLDVGVVFEGECELRGLARVLRVMRVSMPPLRTR
jgi:hypothetical protein